MVVNSVSKQDPKIARNSRISWENWDFPSPKLRFSPHKIWFSSTAFRFPRNPRKSSSTVFQFLQWLSAFFNGFPLSSTAFQFSRNSRKSSSTAFWFLQRLSAFFNGFPLFSKALWFPRNPRKPSTTTFQFLQRLSAFFNGFLLTNYSYLE